MHLCACMERMVEFKQSGATKTELASETVHAIQAHSHSTHGALLKDLGDDTKSVRDVYAQFLAIKKKYDALRTQSTRQQTVSERHLADKEQCIARLRSESLQKDESMEILRIALDSQTKVAAQNRTLYSSDATCSESFSSSSIANMNDKRVVPVPKHSMRRRQRPRSLSISSSMESVATSSLLKRMNVGHRLSMQFEAAMQRINGQHIESKMAAMQHRISRIHSRLARGEPEMAQHVLVHCLWRDSLAMRARTARGQRQPLRFCDVLRCIGFYFVSNIRNMVDCFHDANDGLADALYDAFW